MKPQDNDSNAVQIPLLAGELRVLIGKLKRRLREQAHIGNLTWSQVSVLAHLERDGPSTVTHLAKVEGVRPQSMGATVAGLEAAGLIVGTPDPADGRRTILDLTEACRDLVRKGRAAREDWLSQALSRHFTVAEQGDIARGIELLKRLADS